MRSMSAISPTSAFALVVAISMAPRAALGQEQQIDNVEVGAVFFDNNSFGGIALEAAGGGVAYTILSDLTTTYVNAPNASGSVIFRGGNTASPSVAAPDDSFPSRAYIDSASNLVVAGTVTGGNVATTGNVSVGGHLQVTGGC